MKSRGHHLETPYGSTDPAQRQYNPCTIRACRPNPLQTPSRRSTCLLIWIFPKPPSSDGFCHDLGSLILCRETGPAELYRVNLKLRGFSAQGPFRRGAQEEKRIRDSTATSCELLKLRSPKPSDSIPLRKMFSSLCGTPQLLSIISPMGSQ